jgi:nucleotide-binding universal stress UspA family protein
VDSVTHVLDISRWPFKVPSCRKSEPNLAKSTTRPGAGPWKLQRKRRALRGSLLSIVTIPPAATASPARTSERINVEEALLDSMRRIESSYPGLRIDVTHRSGQVGTALEQSLDKAALLVLDSHHSEQPWSIRVGPIAENLMRRSPCPVMLVGRSAHRRGTN